MAREWERVASDLVTGRYSALVGFAATLTGSRAAAEDLVQEALLATFGRRRNLANTKVAEAYVRRAIASRYVDSTRRVIRERALTEKLAAQPEDVAPAADAHAGGTDDIETALAALSPQERACVVLRHLEQLSTREAATALGLSEGSVKRYLSDGVRKLAAHLTFDPATGEPEWATVGDQQEAHRGR